MTAPVERVAVRGLAAVAGGWLATSGYAQGLAVSAVALGAAPSSAAMAVTLTACLVYGLALLWAFVARSAWRAWGGVLAVYGVGLLLAHAVPVVSGWLGGSL